MVSQEQVRNLRHREDGELGMETQVGRVKGCGPETLTLHSALCCHCKLMLQDQGFSLIRMVPVLHKVPVSVQNRHLGSSKEVLHILILLPKVEPGYCFAPGTQEA